MKGEVKGRWSGRETEHKSGPGGPVECFRLSLRDPLCPLNSPLTGGATGTSQGSNTEEEQSSVVLHLPVACNLEGGQRGVPGSALLSPCSLRGSWLPGEAFLGEQPGDFE